MDRPMRLSTQRVRRGVVGAASMFPKHDADAELKQLRHHAGQSRRVRNGAEFAIVIAVGVTLVVVAYQFAVGLGLVP